VLPRLPNAGEVEFVVAGRRGRHGPEVALADSILANADRLQAGA
jgi:hypothetical protein